MSASSAKRRADQAPSFQGEAVRRLGAALCVAALCVVLAGNAMGADCAAPAVMADGWTVSPPERQGLDATRICAIGPRLEQMREASPNGVVIIRHGVLVHEAYFTGADQRWPELHWKEPLPSVPHDAATKHDVQSITKSVAALLAGIALDRGFIKTVDATVLSFFPDYADLGNADRDRMTLRDLLTMRSGLDWPVTPYLDMGRRTDAAAEPYRLILEQPMVAAPGTRWHYNNGSAELVGGIVQKTTGRPLDLFAKEALFDPLGIEDWEWGHMASGNPAASWGLRLRPRDLAKIGQLVLANGAWHGKQIVSATWIKEMTEPRVVRRNFSYGYFWWLGRSSVAGRDIDWITASGWGGQSLYIVPSLDLVVVVTAGLYDFDGKGGQDLAARTVLNDYVLPAVQGE